MLIGEHGDSQTISWKSVSVGSISIDKYCENYNTEWSLYIKNSIENNVKTMGADIIGRKSYTHYGIATCVCLIADSI